MYFNYKTGNTLKIYLNLKLNEIWLKNYTFKRNAQKGRNRISIIYKCIPVCRIKIETKHFKAHFRIKKKSSQRSSHKLCVEEIERAI